MHCLCQTVKNYSVFIFIIPLLQFLPFRIRVFPFIFTIICVIVATRPTHATEGTRPGRRTCWNGARLRRRTCHPAHASSDTCPKRHSPRAVTPQKAHMSGRQRGSRSHLALIRGVSAYTEPYRFPAVFIYALVIHHSLIVRKI